LCPPNHPFRYVYANHSTKDLGERQHETADSAANLEPTVPRELELFEEGDQVLAYRRLATLPKGLMAAVCKVRFDVLVRVILGESFPQLGVFSRVNSHVCHVYLPDRANPAAYISA
jgi:hypothetical protein